MAEMELRLTPHGVVTPLPADDADRWSTGVVSHFAESEAVGLVTLAASSIPHGTHGSVAFWRDIAADFVRALCHVPETAVFSAADVEMPSAARLAEWTLSAPPMQGAEYLTPEVLSAVWRRLLEWAVSRADACGGLGGLLATYAPQWARVGRVTLHLAENKGDSEYPFAFMATYAAGMSRVGRINRLPLGRALQEYAGARRKPELLKILAPLHAAAGRSELIADLVETGDVFHPLVWTPGEAYAFLKEIPVYEACGLLAQLPDWWRKRSRARVSVTIDGAKRGSVLGKDALLDLRVGMALGEGEDELTPEEVQAILEGSEGLVLLRGQWVEADAEKLREALEHWRRVEQVAGADGLSFVEGMRLLAGAPADLSDAGEDDEGGAQWAMLRAGAGLRELLAGLRSPAGLPGTAPETFRGTLRHYQLDGVNWLWFCSRLGLGCCLADDMGLGKTIQVLAALLRHKASDVPDRTPSLLVVPASLIGNWKAEAARFAPALRVLIAHASETPADALAALAEQPAAGLADADLVITTYGMVSREDWYRHVTWHWVILDEAQAIKNPSTAQTRAAKHLKGAARVALTGTPVENRLGDLWSIFDFLNPGLLGSAARFKTFAKSLEKRAEMRYAPLRNLVAPYILRRLKTDPAIAPDLPEKTEMQVFCGLSRPQTLLYQQSDGPRRNARSTGCIRRARRFCPSKSRDARLRAVSGARTGARTSSRSATMPTGCRGGVRTCATGRSATSELTRGKSRPLSPAPTCTAFTSISRR